MTKIINTLLILIFVLITNTYAFNSLITKNSISEMRENGISQKLIIFIIENQTCSFMASDVITMKNSGLNDDEIIRALNTDLCNKNNYINDISKEELIEKMKIIGMSDEAVLQYINNNSTQSYIKSGTKNFIRYHTGRKQIPVQGSNIPREHEQIPSNISVEINK